MKRIAVAMVLFLTGIHLLSAQGTTQIIITGIPPVMPSPYVSDIEDNFRQGRYQMQLIYANSDPNPAEFVYEVSLFREGTEVLHIISNPVWYAPGTYFYQTFDELPAIEFPDNPVEQLTPDILESVIRTGSLAEGSYHIEIVIRPMDSFSAIQSIPGMAYFEVWYPQPPILISPLDEGMAAPVFTVFSWTPVVGAPGWVFDYELLIVELLPEQTPLQAIEANREHHRHTTQQPLFIYTQEHLPLELGKEYAWMVTAREVNDRIPLSDNGETEIHTFIVGDLIGIAGLKDLESIQLIPGFAGIINLQQLELTTQASSLILDGLATLRIDIGEGGDPVDITVLCSALEIPTSSGDSPIAYGGQVSGSIESRMLPLDGVGDIISLENIQWSVNEGITIEAGILDPGGQLVEASGILSLLPSGLAGQLSATGPGGTPLFTLGMNPMEVIVQEITANFPGGYLTLDAQVLFFDTPTPCGIREGFFLDGNLLNLTFNCAINDQIPLIPGQDLATLSLSMASGEISFEWGAASYEYRATVNGAIRLEAMVDKAYTIPMMASVSSGGGVSFELYPPSVLLSPPPIDLGLAQLTIVRLLDPLLSYDPPTSMWDFGISMDAELVFPAFDDLKIPGLRGVTIDRNGFIFPDINLDEQALQWLPQLDLAGFGAKLLSFNMPSFTFPWFDWDGMTADLWDFSFDFELSTPQWGMNMPACLRNLSLRVDEARFSGGAFSAELPLTSFNQGACSIELGPGYVIAVSQLGGGIYGMAQGSDFTLSGHASLDGTLTLGSPFNCDASVSINLHVHGDGIIMAELANPIPGCPVNIGPYSATVEESLLRFGRDGQSQTAFFDASASLEFPAPAGGIMHVTGELGVDLISGEFYTLNFDINDHFVWVIPSDKEVLRFNIDRARISMDGLSVNGTQTFILGDETISVDINELLLDLHRFRIKEGNIMFTESFAFEVGIRPDDFSLVYGSVPLGHELTMDPGIQFDLAGTIMIDSLGLHATGSADASLNFAGYAIDELSVLFSDGFAFGLDPFQVESGQIDVHYNGQTIAIIDAFGFHPVLSFFGLTEVIPQHLPMPNPDIAYLVLKRDDELLIDVEQDPDHDFAVRLSTKPGQGIEFVFPVLQGDQTVPPSLTIEFSDVMVSLAPLRFAGGEIHVSIPDFDDRFNLENLGIPLSLKQISYGEFEFEQMVLDGLFLGGFLNLFEQELGEEAWVTFFVNSDGSLNASVNIEDMGAHIPLVPGSDLAVLSIEAISGWARYHLLQPAMPEFQFTLSGGFEIGINEQNQARASISLEYNRQGIQLSEFAYDISSPGLNLNLSHFLLQVDEILALDLSYVREQGFDFFARLDLGFGMQLETLDTLLIGLQGVEIRPSGFVIPAQEINDGSDPPLQLQPFTMMGFELQPLAFRIPGVVVDIWNLSPENLLGLIPSFDFALGFPGLADISPALADVSLTVTDAGFQNGRFTGSVEMHRPIIPIQVPLGDMAMEIMEFSGSLYEEVMDGLQQQSIDVMIAGSIPAFFGFESETPCDPIAVSLHIAQGKGFSGTLENFLPCGEMTLGSLSLGFGSSSLSFGFLDEQQSAILSGQATLRIPRQDTAPVNVSGELSLNLISGSILSGAIEISEPFRWSFPATTNDPFLDFTVQQARLDSQGLTLRAAGSMEVGDNIDVDVVFDDLVIDIRDLSITDGEASISSGFAFELLFLPVDWRLVALQQAIPDDVNVIRMDFANIGMTLDRDGLAFNGEATAKVSLPGLEVPDIDPDELLEQLDQELIYENLRLVFHDNFRMHMPPTSSAKSGRAEIWMGDSDDATLLAWYDTDGLGLGDFLGVLPIPDTLGLPTKEIAYMVLKDPEGYLLVELDTQGGHRTLKTKDGASIDIVIPGLAGEQGGSPPSFSTQFAITVNDAFGIVAGSVGINLAGEQFGNRPFKVPGMPLTLTSLTYEKGDEGVGVLTASAILDLPESLNELQVVIDELRFSQNGFEQATFSIGREDYTEEDTPAVTQSFAEDALIIDVHYAMVSIGQTNAFEIKGDFRSSLFMDQDTETYTPLPFEASYQQSSNPGMGWHFALGFDHTQPIELAVARFSITEFAALATADAFALQLSAVVSIPDVLGDGFAVTIEELSIGTSGIAIGQVLVDAPKQEFMLFDERVRVLVSSISPSYQEQQKALLISLDGELEVLGRIATFTDMTIGTNGTFSIGGGLDVNLLTEEMEILPKHLIIKELNFGLTGESKLKMGLNGRVSLPEPFSQSSDFTVQLTQLEGINVDVSVQGPAFQLASGYGISPDRTQVTLGDFATLDLTAVAVNLDFKDIRNTTFLATAAVYVENNTNKRIMFGEAASIDQNWGFRYNYHQGFSWRITSTASQNNTLFSFDAGFFSIEISSVTTIDGATSFGLDIAGNARLSLPGVSGEAAYEGFKVTETGIEDIGRFTGSASFTLMEKVALSWGEFIYLPSGGSLSLTREASDSRLENPTYETYTIQTKKHLLITNAEIDLQGSGNGGGFDGFGGGVERILFYINPDDELHLYIDNASLHLGDLASITASMRYITTGTSYYLGVAGSADFTKGGVKAEMALVGKIEKSGDDLSFGFFVKADVSTGIPLVPGIVTLMGAGGGFYYRPAPEDFTLVRDAAGLNYIQTPQPREDTRFAAFLYAKLGLVGEQTYAIDGKFFLEITDQSVSLHANGIIMGQQELKVDLSLNLEFGETLRVQGLVRATVDYKPWADGVADMGFFAQNNEGNLIWAIYGDVELNVLIVKVGSRFIVCNDGMLVDASVEVGVEGWWGHVKGGLEASIWYVKTSGFGIYGKLYADINVMGVGVEGWLYGAYISNQRLFYASGGVSVDLVLTSTEASVWIAYHNGWDGGTGSDPAYEAMIASARAEAEAMYDIANQAASEVEEALAELNAAADVAILMEEVEDYLLSLPHIQEKQDEMQSRIDYVNQLAPSVVDRLRNVTRQAIELQEEVSALAAAFDNPLTFSEGILSGADDQLEVAANPSLALDESKAGDLETHIEQGQEEQTRLMEHYLESITKALSNLAELETIIEGNTIFTGSLLNGLSLVTGHQIQLHLSEWSNPGIGTQFVSTGIVRSAGPNFNYLGEKYAEAVMAVKDFYATSIGDLWRMRAIYAGYQQHDYARAALELARQFDDKYQEAIIPVEAGHVVFTESLDALYLTKASMVTTIYGMLQSYARMLDDFPEEKQPADIEGLQQEMIQKLQPPVISSLIINPHYHRNHNRADILWAAQHADELVETSYAIQEAGMGEFGSAGSIQSLQHYTWKRTLDELERNQTIAVRVRGSGGNTAIRMAHMSLAVDGRATSTPSGEQLPDQVLPPSAPNVNFPYHFVIESFIRVQSDIRVPVRKFFSSHQGQIDLVIWSHSAQSDIASFQYAVGTTKGGTDILDWTTAVGVIQAAHVSEGGVAREIKTSITGLQLEHNTHYYVSARAYDTYGNFSETNMDSYILYDATPPSVPELISTLSTQPVSGQGSTGLLGGVSFVALTPITYPQLASAPPWHSGKYHFPAYLDVPVYSISWRPSEDPESGIYQYEYVLTHMADAQAAFRQSSAIVGITSTGVSLTDCSLYGGMINFTDSFYLYLRAINRAGNASDILTVFPVIATDPSVPTTPRVNVRLVPGTVRQPGGVRLHIPYLSMDGESQVAGYQYSVGTTPGSSNVRSWGTGINFPQIPTLRYDRETHVMYVDPEVYQVPAYIIPASVLSEKTSLYVNVRAVNRQGMLSETVSTGPFQLGTAPMNPKVYLRYSGRNSMLTIEIDDIYDAGAAISAVSYRVRNNTTGQFLTSSPVVIRNMRGFYPEPESTLVNVSVPSSTKGYRVDVSVTNTAGKATSTSATYSHPVSTISPINTPVFIPQFGL